MCTSLWNVNGCLISQVGDIEPVNFVPTNNGVWSTGPTPKGKRCPKASSYISYTIDSTPDVGSTDRVSSIWFVVAAIRLFCSSWHFIQIIPHKSALGALHLHAQGNERFDPSFKMGSWSKY